MKPRDIAKALGRRGGLARARKLTAEQRRKIASLGGHARRESRLAAERIVVNFRYVDAIRKLRGGMPKIVSVKSCRSRLPGIYRSSQNEMITKCSTDAPGVSPLRSPQHV